MKTIKMLSSCHFSFPLVVYFLVLPRQLLFHCVLYYHSKFQSDLNALLSSFFAIVMERFGLSERHKTLWLFLSIVYYRCLNLMLCWFGHLYIQQCPTEIQQCWNLLRNIALAWPRLCTRGLLTTAQGPDAALETFSSATE